MLLGLLRGVSYFKDLETKGYQYTNGCINRCAETDGTLSEGPNELWMLSVVHSLVLGEASAQSGRQGFESSSAISSPCSLEPVPYLPSLDSVVPKVPVTETQSVFGLSELFRGSGEARVTRKALAGPGDAGVHIWEDGQWAAHT